MRGLLDCAAISQSCSFWLSLCAGAWIEREALLRARQTFGLCPIRSHLQMLLSCLAAESMSRPFVAADLYAKGLVKKVLLSEVKEGAISRHRRLPGIPNSTERFF